MYSTWLTFPHIMLVCTVTLHKEASSSRSLQRDSRFRFAHFIDHLFHILDVPELESIHVRDRRVCLLYCLRDKRCFSTNLAAKPDINDNYVCELLPTDKYNASDSFKPSQHFNHYSAKTPCLSNPCQNNGSCRALYYLEHFWCECLPNYSGRYCEKWLVELPYNVCMYGLSDRPGVFFTPLAGKIYFIRLVHISGSVGCAIRQKANWGCHSNIGTILTDKDKNVVYPEDQRARAYQLFGFSKNSPELMLKFTTPLVVAAGQEYQVWFLEDLTDIYEGNNNPGPSCMKVIYLFSL